MGNKKTFINPFTRSSEEDINIPTSLENVPQQIQTTSNNSSLGEFLHVRKRGNKAFEKTHERFTGWIDKQLKMQFFRLAQEKGVSKTSLFNEAIADLLRKYIQK